MILIAGVDNYVNVPMEITTFLGATFAFIALALVFFLYINRKWCFRPPKGSFAGCDESLLANKTLYNLKNKFHENTSSDSEEEVLRRLRQQQSHNNQQYNGLQQIQVSKTSAPETDGGGSSKNSKTYRHVKHLRDPLGLAERGKIGHSSSECSSNSSVEASVESNAGLMNGERKDRKQYYSKIPTGSGSGSGTPLPEAKNTESRADRRHSSSASSNRYAKIGAQDSLDDVPDINSNNQDCIVTLSQEPLFDTSDLKSIKSNMDPSSRNGSLEIALLYDAPMRKMTVHVLQARGIPCRDKVQQIHTQVRLLMLPSKKQKHKTRIRPGENPQFMESFLLHRVNPEEVNSMGIRVRVYGCERMRRERLIGEAIVSFASIDLELETNLWLPLEPKSNGSVCGSTSDLLSLARSDSTGSTTSMQHGGVPELLIGLGYNGITGRLSVEVVKGSHFRNVALSKAPDTYVKLCLVSSMGHEMARAKSSTRRGQPNPLFKETFIFQVALFQLNDVTLIISVYAKRNIAKRNEMVGWFSLGLNSSGPEELAHWADVRESSSTRTELISRWHVLVDS